MSVIKRPQATLAGFGPPFFVKQTGGIVTYGEKKTPALGDQDTSDYLSLSLVGFVKGLLTS